MHNCDQPAPEVKIEKRQGLCITATVECSTCKFISPQCRLFTTIKKPRGPEAGSLNDALVIPVLKSKMGLNDVRFLLSCINVQPPAFSGLQRKLNKVADHVIEMNTKSMAANQEYVRQVSTMAGYQAKVNVETDAAYNNRPQSGVEAATQSFSPMIEQDTCKKLVLAMQTANKHCSKRNCNHRNRNCKQNFGTAETISSSESKLVQKNLESIHMEGKVEVQSVTSDASTQIEKSIRDFASKQKKVIRHYKCFVHKLCNLQKHLKNIRLTTKLSGLDKEVYLNRLSSAIRARVRLELVRIKAHFPSCSSFIKHSEDAIANILPCFSGKHGSCRQISMVCTAHLESYNTSFLPYGKHIELNNTDMLRLTKMLQEDFSTTNLEKISRLSNTNRSESLNHRVFTYAPKSTIWSWNFTGLCHSAVHSSTLGNGKSSLLIASSLGIKYKISDPIFKQMLKIDSNFRYHTARKQSKQYKMSRYFSQQRRSCRKMRYNSLYANAQPSVSHEHAYGININI